jgi:Uma2 family endonuclease
MAARPIHRWTANEDVLLNPTLVIEVLSPSTEARDRGDKFHAYTSIASLREVIFIVQNQPRLESFARDAQGHWSIQTVQGLEQQLHVTAIGCTLALRDVYDKVTFESAQED